MDNSEKYSPVPRYDTIRAILSTAASEKLLSSRYCNRKCTNVFSKYGLQISDNDPCLFLNDSKDHKLIMALYIDDGLVAALHQCALDQFPEELRSHFEITISPVLGFLGFQIIQYDDGSIFVYQKN